MKTIKQSGQIPPQKKHQQQFLFEILLPLIIAGILFLSFTTIAIIMLTKKNALLSQWADISLILLVVPVLILCIVFIILSIVIVKTFARWNVSIPPFLEIVRFKYDFLAGRIQKIINQSASPVIQVQSIITAISQVFTSLRK